MHWRWRYLRWETENQNACDIISSKLNAIKICLCAHVKIADEFLRLISLSNALLLFQVRDGLGASRLKTEPYDDPRFEERSRLSDSILVFSVSRTKIKNIQYLADVFSLR